MRGDRDEVECEFKGYQLYREEKTWSDARAHCKGEGGQLAAIHSDWEQELAKRAANGSEVWIGGKNAYHHGSGEWEWADNSTWDFTNWESGSGYIPNYAVFMQPNGEWREIHSWFNKYFICQKDTVTIAEKGLTTFELKKEQEALFPFYVVFKSKGVNQEVKSSSEQDTVVGRL